MGSMFTQTFSELMDVKDRCVSVEELTTLIVREVRDIINCALHSLEDSEEPVKSRITPSKRINAMVKHAIEILKEFAAKIKSFCTSLPNRKTDKTIVAKDVEEDVKMTDWFQNKYETPSSSVGSETSVTAVSRAVQKVIGQELNQILEPVSDELSDSNYTLLQSESSREISFVADDVAKLIVQESHNFKQCGFASPSPEIQESCIMCIDRVVVLEETGPSVVSHSVCEEAQAKPQQDSKWQTQKRKTQLRVVLEMVVTQTYTKAKVSRGMGKSEAIIDHLLQKTWAELKGIEFDIRGSTFELFGKAIFRNVYRTVDKAMEETGEMRIEEAKMSDLRRSFEGFVKKLTLEQHRLLILGEPDKSTRLMLAKKCMDLILCLSIDIIKAVKDFQGQTEHQIFSKMGSMFTQTFSELMDVKGRCVSVEELTTLIVREVRDIINCALHSLEDSEETEESTIISSKRINAMVEHTIEILKEFAAKMKSFCTSLPRSMRGKLIITEDVEEDLNEDVKLKDWFQNKYETPSSSVGLETSVIAVSRAVQKVIGQELNQLFEPISDELSDSDYSLLQSESSREIGIVADNVAKIIVEERFKLCGFASQSPEIQESWILSIDRVVNTDENYEDDRYACVFLRFKTIFCDKIPEITQGLTDLFYSHFRHDAPMDVTAYTTIKNRVCCYLGLTNWWLNSEVSKVSEKVIHLLMETRLLVKTVLPEVVLEETGPSVVSHSVCEEAQAKPQQDSRWQTKTRKTQLRVVLEMVVTHAYTKAKVSRGMGKSEAIIDHLLQKTWAELKGIDFDIRGSTFELFGKAIFRNVCEKSGTPAHALMLLQLRDPQIEECIISYLKHHVTQPLKQHNTVSSFFSAVRKAIASVFRQRNEVSVT
ncbi:hypothetical protein Q8A73_022234 [Channa argus]|nr:hypothetical protein Q8A73_022234 [Channa argus]